MYVQSNLTLRPHCGTILTVKGRRSLILADMPPLPRLRHRFEKTVGSA
jgi:hypothetical protein